MKVKVGDKVKVIAGSDKGKEGNVTKVLKATNRVIIAGVHIVKKHMKPTRTNETGGILETEAPIHASNVKVIEKGVFTKSKKEKSVAKETVKKEPKVTTKEVKKEPKKVVKKTVTKNAATRKVGGSK